MQIKIEKLHPAAQAPTYATDGSGCFDLRAVGLDNPAYVWGGHQITLGTGLAFEIPLGWVMLVFSRSGHGFNHDTRLANCVGVIDADYRGEVKVRLTRDTSSKDVLVVRTGDRIAQAMLVPAEKITFEFADELSPTARGTGGLGSTGA